MVDPVTIAAGASAIGGFMGYKGNMAAARNAQAVGEYNAKIAENEKVLVSRRTREQERQLRVNSERIAATQRVMAAKSGVQMTGSPMDALFDTLVNTEFDGAKIRYAGSVDEANKEAEAGLRRLEANAQAAAFRTQAMGSFVGGVAKSATLLT